MDLYERISASAETIRAQIGNINPKVGIILGSGLTKIEKIMDHIRRIPYDLIPGFKHSSSPGHESVLLVGTIHGVGVCCMLGRHHYYEGYSLQEIAFPVYVLQSLGCKVLITSCAAGVVNRRLRPGEMMLLSDHIKLCLDSPLRGENDDRLGVRFPDISCAYDPQLGKMMMETGMRSGIRLREGVYMFFPGPHYETPAEIRAANILGADAVGMSTVPEVIAANHCGIKVIAIAILSNMAAGLTKRKLTEQEVLTKTKQVESLFCRLISGFIENLRTSQYFNDNDEMKN